MSELSAWTVAFADRRDGRDPVVCPGCASETLDWCVDGEPGTVGFGAVWCRTCGRGTWISRLDVRPGDIQCSSKEVPDFEDISL
jgi:hypothetical protein